MINIIFSNRVDKGVKMIFDAHGDILTDITNEKKKGIDIWQEYHQPRYKKAKITGSIFINFIDPNSENKIEEFHDIHDYALDYFRSRSEFNVINHNNWSETHFNLIFGVEGLSAISSVDELLELYKLGYRHIGLTWNEKNHFATGAMNKGGLTKLGKEVIQEAEKLKMIIDFAHLNEKSFWQAAEVVSRPIFVSHANIKAKVDHPRNLTDQQLLAIKESNGVIGLTVMAPFLNENPENASLNDYIEHVKYVIEKIGVDHVGFGFDFCQYLGGHDLKNPVVELEDISQVQSIINELEKIGLSKNEIAKICYKNMERVINAHLTL